MSLPTESTIHERGPSALRSLGPAGHVIGRCRCCGEQGIGAELYSALEKQDLPDAAVLASLGCGNPTAVAELQEGDRVLDLGSGAASTCSSRPSGSGRAVAPSAWT